MAAQSCEHKVRGGCALSLALGHAAGIDAAPSGCGEPRPCLDELSPSGSGFSSLTASQQQHTSEQLSTSPWPSPTPSPSAEAAGMAPAAVEGPRPLAHSAATAPRDPDRRRRRPFLSCFGVGGGTRVLGEDDAAVQQQQQQPAVSASEVGIRPCFYWLEGPHVSEEARLFAEANARWLKSDCQDDAVVMESFAGLTHQTFAGVFDGHGPHGRAAAKFASTRLPQALAARMAGGGGERRRLRAMRDAFLEVNSAMLDVDQAGFDASLSGTTACCALVVGRKVLVASTGDSRCVVARRGAGGGLEVVPLTWDAKPSLPEERKRIAESGGVVKQLLDERGERVGAFRVFSRGDDVLPGLAMSRSLGDLYAHSVGVSPEPVMNTYTLGERDLFLILATDGLWDIMGNEEAADFVERYKARRDAQLSCAEAITLEAQERWKALHNEAIVDDISCVILHTAGLPPADRRGSVPCHLARAASCNDEANELYARWRREKEANPSNHRPKQYFKHLYGEEAGISDQSGSGAENSAGVRGLAGSDAGRAPLAERAGQEPALAELAARTLTVSPPPPASPVRLDTLQYPTRHLSSLAGSSASPLESGGHRLSSLCSPSADSALGGCGGGGGGGLRRQGTLSSQSPISSCGDLASEGASEHSGHSTRRGGSFAGLGLGRRSSGPQPIPSARAGIDVPASQSLPLDALLRPVRKAYPSVGSMQQLSLSHSLRSDGSGTLGALCLGDTPHSGDGASLERKVRGGMSRSLSVAGGLALRHPAAGHPSHPSLASLQQRSSPLTPTLGQLARHHHPSSASLPQHPSTASLLTSGRSSADFRGSAPGSPCSDSLLGAQLSPQPSPVVVSLNASYTRLQVGGSRVVHAVAPLDARACGMMLPASTSLDADVAARGCHLSRRATDTAGLAHALKSIEEAGSGCAVADDLHSTYH